MMKVFFAAIVVVVVVCGVGAEGQTASALTGVWRGTSNGCNALLQMRANSFLYMSGGPTTSCPGQIYVGGWSLAGDYSIMVTYANSQGSGGPQPGDSVEFNLGLSNNDKTLIMRTEAFDGVYISMTKGEANADATFEGGWTTSDSSGNPGFLELQAGLFYYGEKTSAGAPSYAAIGEFTISGDTLSVTIMTDTDANPVRVQTYTLAKTANGFTMTAPSGAQYGSITVGPRPTGLSANGVWVRETDGCVQFVEVSNDVMFRSVKYNCLDSNNQAMDFGFVESAGGSSLYLYYMFVSPGTAPSTRSTAAYNVAGNTMTFTPSGAATETYSKLTTAIDSKIVTIRVDGDLSSFSDTTYRNALASYLGVNATDVIILSKTAGSVIVKTGIQSTSTKSATASLTQLQSTSSFGSYTVQSVVDSTPTSPAQATTSGTFALGTSVLPALLAGVVALAAAALF